jgi:hypothetical protein
MLIKLNLDEDIDLSDSSIDDETTDYTSEEATDQSSEESEWTGSDYTTDESDIEVEPPSKRHKQ